MFKAVWGFDPEEALQAQNAFQQTSVPGFDASLNELERQPDDELKIPPAGDLQIYELHRMFGL